MHALRQRDLIELIRHHVRPGADENKQKDEKKEPNVGDAVLPEAAPDNPPVARLNRKYLR
jgi:hypothetical protein